MLDEYLLPDIIKIVNTYIEPEIKWSLDTTTLVDRDIFKWESQITHGSINLVSARKTSNNPGAYCPIRYEIEFQFQPEIKGFIYQYLYKDNCDINKYIYKEILAYTK